MIPILFIEEIDDQVIDWRVFIRYVGNDTFTLYSTRRPQELENSKFGYYTFQIIGTDNLVSYMKTIFSNRCRVNTTIFMANVSAFTNTGFHFESLLDHYYNNSPYNELIGYDEEKPKRKFLKNLVLSIKSII